MTTVLVSAGTTLVILVVAGIVLALTRRSQASTEERMTFVIRDLNERMETMRRELSAALVQPRRRVAATARSGSSRGRSTSTRS